MKKITEEEGLQKQWYAEAKDMTMEKLPAFLKKLTTEFEHDYGTICHAIASAAIAAAWAVERTPQGGITGFQAGAIMWEFIEHWGVYQKGPLRILEYRNMLYPQYTDKFEKTISKNTWEWLQEEAQKLLTEEVETDYMSPSVKEHLENIVKGQIPFGFKVEEE